MAYQPIENYGIIGDMRTAALVGMNGSIDWFPYPQFDSPSVFGAILDDKKGGRYKIAPTKSGWTSRQFYWPETNVLVTRFLSPEGVGQVIDSMPVGLKKDDPWDHALIRRVTAVRGTISFRLECLPAWDYGRAVGTASLMSHGARFDAPELVMELLTSTTLQVVEGGGVEAEFVLREGETAAFVFREADPNTGGDPPEFTTDESQRLFDGTVDYWSNWLAQSTYKGRWREMVYRSALTLKLLTFEPTGAIVAAPTCSLPENIGGDRNWDYRYTWIRDSAFTLYALLRIGFTSEARQFMKWIEERCGELDENDGLCVMYPIDSKAGVADLHEEVLDHLDGYMGSRPVRKGNGAAHQLQLDIYGELMDAVYLYNKYGEPISYKFWTSLRRLTNWVCDHWQLPDEGIWEVRGGQQHFVYSKLMCWVAVDRAIRLADRRSFPADRERWLKTRDAIYEEIMAKGWSPKRQAFVQAYGSETLDAANLLMPLVFYMSPADPQMISTLEATNRSPDEGGLVSNGLVFRYNVDETDDGLGSSEGTFNVCTFWLVEAMTRAGKGDRSKLREARLMFEHMMTYANHLGLYGEETGPSGEALGNFPLAFTHVGLISAAFNLDRALGKND